MTRARGKRGASSLAATTIGIVPRLPHTGCHCSAEVDRYITAADSAREMLRHPDDDRYRLRLFHELIRGTNEVDVAAIELVAAEPPLVGDQRFDALLGAAAEYVAARPSAPRGFWQKSGTAAPGSPPQKRWRVWPASRPRHGNPAS